MTVRRGPLWAGVLIVVVGLVALGSTSRAAAAEGDQGTRAWPVAGVGGWPRPVVMRGFEPPPRPWAAGHRGVDLAADRGSPVRAAAAGRVVFAGRVAGRGVVSIELAQPQAPPLRITYEPVDAMVTVGDSMAAGQLVGTVGPGPFHCPEGCLHWGLLRGEEYLDPLSLMPPGIRRGGPSRLLPVFGVPPPGAADGLMPGAALGLRALQHHTDGGLGDKGRVLGDAELDAAGCCVDDALEQHRGEPGLVVPELTEGLDDHGDQSAVRRTDLLTGARIQFAGRDGDDRAMPPVSNEGELPSHICLDLFLGCSGLLHSGLHLSSPDREVDGAQLLDNGGAGAEVLVDGGAGKTGALSEGRERQCLGTALGKESACGFQQGVALHRAVLGHRGRSDPWHPSTLRTPP